MLCRFKRLVAGLALAACALALAPRAFAQAGAGAVEHPDSRVDVYGGYGYFHPLNSGIDGFQYFDVTNPNATASITGYFNHYFGVAVEGGYFAGSAEHTQYDPRCVSTGCDQLVYTAQAGPVVRLPLGSFVPFIHALGGGTRANGPVTQPLTWGWGVTGGVGIDYVVPWARLKNRLALRPIQADWQYSQVVYGPLVLPVGTEGGFGEISNIKLSGGLVLRIGDATPPQPVMLSCVADPQIAHPGDTVTVTGSTTGLDPKRQTEWKWAGNGGKLTFSGPTATLETAGMQPGEYMVQGRVAQGMKARQQAACDAAFQIKPFEPPTITCEASPASAASGTVIDIITHAISPQNRPLTYSYQASTGGIAGDGPTAKLTTAGLGAVTVTVTCNVVDDFGQVASSTAQVAVTAPQAPVIPETQPLCSIGFERDRRRPVRVDNESKACLDDIALTLGQQGEAKLVMVGNASPDEKAEAAAERAMNARQYLTEEKGIDAGRIELRVGDTSGRNVRNILVPAGAAFADGNTQPFDEHVIVRHGQAYGHGQHRPANLPAAVPHHRHHHTPASPAAAPAPTPTPASGPAPTSGQVPLPPGPASLPPTPQTHAPASPTHP